MEQPDTRPFVAPCRELQPSMAFKWLRQGWADYRAAPALSLAWGMASFVISAAVALLSWFVGGWILLLTMLSGFVLIGPLMAFGLYSVSRQLCLGDKPQLARTLRAFRKPIANALVFALVILVIFLLWARAATMVHIFFPSDGTIHARDLLLYLGVGTAVGAVFAAISFAASVFSLPFIANRDVDVVTAVVSSINAVLRNRWTMLAWGVLVVLLVVIGFLTAMVGFVVIIPWLAYGTWHGYRDALVVDDWDVLPSLQQKAGK